MAKTVGDRFIEDMARDIDSECTPNGHKFSSKKHGDKCPKCGAAGNLIKRISMKK